ncbi:UNVERIFIED_CONTAM: hypothetical protein Cloal_3292 [Acetivibrio alkalicellulosi]
MDIILSLVLLFMTIYIGKITIDEYKQGGKITEDFFSLKNKRFLFVLFALGFLFIEDINIKFVVFTFVILYFVVLLNVLNILSYRKSKNLSIIKNSVILSVPLIVLYIVVFLLIVR